jgi:hypothetical protein
VAPVVENRDAYRVLLGRHGGRRILEDLGVDGNGSNGSSVLLIILPDEDDMQFLYRITVYTLFIIL